MHQLQTPRILNGKCSKPEAFQIRQTRTHPPWKDGPSSKLLQNLQGWNIRWWNLLLLCLIHTIEISSNYIRVLHRSRKSCSPAAEPVCLSLSFRPVSPSWARSELCSSSTFCTPTTSPINYCQKSHDFFSNLAIITIWTQLEVCRCPNVITIGEIY